MSILIKIGIFIGYLAAGIILTKFIRFLFEKIELDDTSWYHRYFTDELGIAIHVLLWPLYSGLETLAVVFELMTKIIIYLVGIK